MVRVALLVTILAVLCYTSQAYNSARIPAQVGNTELRKDISDQIQQILNLIPKEVQEIEDFKNKFTKNFEQLVNEAEKGKTTAINVFEKAKENAKKLLQEGKKNENQVLEKLKNVEQEIVTNYQYTLNDRIQSIKDTFGKLNKEEKQKLKEKLDSFQGKIMNDADEVIKKFKENINEMEKDNKVEELKNILDKSFNSFKLKAIKNIKDEVGKVKRSVDDVIRYRRQAGGIIGELLDRVWKRTKNIGDTGIKSSKDILDNMKKFLNNEFITGKGTKQNVKENTEGEDIEGDTEI
ncbi:hypothetical protein ALC53_10226 [Atta colombica]|uniref:Laminin subunit alpha-2 n=1 Tax=Atta colombica TaxID=520822 RepID=A0A151I0M3_9HYME|nr:hypothetical protein ALC53_10226 [Atta colombica]